MTQRVFDVENEKDMQDLWDILPDDVVRLSPVMGKATHIDFEKDEFNTILFAINWHDKTEIRRPIQEVNESDVGKLCKFWSDGTKEDIFGKLTEIDNKASNYKYRMSGDDCLWFEHCRRLTKHEIEELC